MMNINTFGLILLIAVILVVIFFVMKKFVYKKSVTENFPQSSPMNVMYTDDNGNISVTNDVGLQNLTISNDGALLLGNKFRFNGGSGDDWLRMMNKDNTGYYGGLAAGQLYSAGDTKVDGNLSINGYNNVKTTIDDLYNKTNELSSKIDTVSTTLSTISTTLSSKINTLSTSTTINAKDIVNIKNAFKKVGFNSIPNYT